VRCHTFITESTFGLPIYRWQPQTQIFAEINQWWRANAAADKTSVLFCYAFGKAQRILHGIDASLGPILVHGAVEPINRIYRESDIYLPPTIYTGEVKKHDPMLRKALVIAPPSAGASPWVRRFGDYSDGFASGWMRLRGTRRRRGVDRGFVLSDHADWPGLLWAIEQTGAERVIVTHGSIGVLVRHLRELGLDAMSFSTEYGDDEDTAILEPESAEVLA
jgi:putative mRNA 3-end processing factor